MHRRVVTLACTALAATIAVLVPPAAEAQRVVVRRDGSAQPPRTTARTPARTPARTARPPARRPVATTQRATVVQVRRAESGPSRQLTLSVGALRYEPDGDDNQPMAAL